MVVMKLGCCLAASVSVRPSFIVISPVLHTPVLPSLFCMLFSMEVARCRVCVSVAASVSIRDVPCLCVAASSSAGSVMEILCDDIHSHSLYIQEGEALLAGLVVKAVLSMGLFVTDSFWSLSIASSMTALTRVPLWLSACVSMLSRSVLTTSAHLFRFMPTYLPHTTCILVFLFIPALFRRTSLSCDWAVSIWPMLALENFNLYRASARVTLLEQYRAWSAVTVCLLSMCALMRTDLVRVIESEL